MNKTQIAKRESYGRVVKLITDNAVALEGVVGLLLDKADLIVTNTNIDTASTAQATPAIGPAASSEALTLMGETIVKYTYRAVVKLRRLGNTTLADQLDEPESFYTKGSKLALIARANATRKILNDNLGLIVVVVAADITEIDATIQAFIAAKDVPVSGQIANKAAGTDLLPPYFIAGTLSVTNILYLVRSYIGKTNAELTGKIELSAELIVAGSKHNEIDFTVEANEDSSLLAGAQVMDLSNNKIYTPDSDGIIVIPTHRVGLFSFVISCPGRIPVTLATTIKRGIINDFTVKLLSA